MGFVRDGAVSAVRAGTVHFVVPEGVADPARVSGGNVYDRRLGSGLSAAGWDVRRSEVEVGSPESARAALAAVPDGGVVLIDGLVAGRAAEAMEDSAARLRLVVLAHMVSASFPRADPLVIDDERRAFRAAATVIVTSAWTRSQLVARGLMPLERIVVATPGADRIDAGEQTGNGSALLCVGVVTAHKGQDILIEALAGMRATPTWRCTIVGSTDADPHFAERLAARAAELGIEAGITMAGVLEDDALDGAYRACDLLVAPSRVESYGMAIADALSRGIPVVASRVGGIPLTVAPGRSAVLVRPEPRALGAALERWMTDPALRSRLKGEALRGRTSLPRWTDTVDRVAAALVRVR
jgi:glycosyltransferase involved in cell wall biosynthesis